ncbi:MAG: hypothetical protein WBO35_03935 [Candidatus Saccharimonadales bacterium]
MDEATLTQLLNTVNSTSEGGTASLFDIDAIIQSLAPYILAMTVVSALIMILYLVSVIGKWRANKAMLDIRKLLIEMNERDKARSGVSALHTVSGMGVKETSPSPSTPHSDS